MDCQIFQQRETLFCVFSNFPYYGSNAISIPVSIPSVFIEVIPFGGSIDNK